MKVGRVEDLPAAVPRRLSRQGRRRQGSRLHRHDEEDRGAAPARSRRGVRQVARHRRRHASRRCAPTCARTSSARSSSASQARNKASVMDALVKARRTRRAEGAGRRRDRAHGRDDARRPEAARREGRRERADPGRDVPGRRPSAACAWAWWSAELVRSQQPAGQARAAAGAHRGDVAELREADRSDALVPAATASAWPRSRPWWSRTTSPTSCSARPR